MVDVLVILDGASDPGGSLERAHMPALRALGAPTPQQFVPAGLPAGSEHAIPTLLGWTPTGIVDRGAIEAAAHGIVAPRAFRIDGPRGAAAPLARLRALLPDHDVHEIGGHRLLAVGDGPLPPLPPDLHVWPSGVVPPRVLDRRTTVIAAPGSCAAGIARLMGAKVVTPAGTTGDTDTDIAAKLAAARLADADRVIVHVGGADEASHRRDAGAKVAFLERVDHELIAPLVAAPGFRLTVCPDHGCDPATGLHDDGPVPVVEAA